MSDGEPIIIKGGGSVEILLPKDDFPADSPNSSRHYNAERRITRMSITDDATEQVTTCPIPDSGKFTITIEHSK